MFLSRRTDFLAKRLDFFLCWHGAQGAAACNCYCAGKRRLMDGSINAFAMQHGTGKSGGEGVPRAGGIYCFNPAICRIGCVYMS